MNTFRTPYLLVPIYKSTRKESCTEEIGAVQGKRPTLELGFRVSKRGDYRDFLVIFPIY
jgi:hypothetical protein